MCKINQEKIKEYFLQIIKHKKLFIIFSGAIILMFTMFALGTRLTLAYHEKIETEKKIHTMKTFLNEWDEKNTKLQNYASRPVTSDQVESIQTHLIFQIQNRKLELKSMKDSQKKDTDGRSFEVEFTGDYNTTISFLDYLQNNEVLIAIKSISMQKRGKLIDTKLMYKIYTAGGSKK